MIMNKITVIGSGSVGATISYTLSVMGLATEIVMIDINEEKALGEAMDIRQGLPFCNPCTVYAGTYEDAKGSDIVIITCGLSRGPGQTRLDLAQTNVEVLKSVAVEIVKYAPEAIYLIVSNPVDILTYVFCKVTGLPQSRVIGSGTILDTARLRARVSEYYNVNQKNVHAYVLGEHGDSAFVPWSIANISNVPIEDYRKSIIGIKDYPEFNKEEIENYVKNSGSRVIAQKGATYYAVSISVCHVCKCLASGIDTTLTVSTMLNGEYGIDDVCLSLLNVVDNKGAHSKIILPLQDNEIAALHNSANKLKSIMKDLKM